MKHFGSANESGYEAEGRPTIPVPRPSPVRIQLVQVAYAFARIDEVVADLARDPRSEYCYERSSGPALVKTADVLVPRIAPLRTPNLRNRRRA